MIIITSDMNRVRRWVSEYAVTASGYAIAKLGSAGRKTTSASNLVPRDSGPLAKWASRGRIRTGAITSRGHLGIYERNACKSHLSMLANAIPNKLTDATIQTQQNACQKYAEKQLLCRALYECAFTDKKRSCERGTVENESIFRASNFFTSLVEKNESASYLKSISAACRPFPAATSTMGVRSRARWNLCGHSDGAEGWCNPLCCSTRGQLRTSVPEKKMKEATFCDKM